jgi:hypothetical protein
MTKWLQDFFRSLLWRPGSPSQVASRILKIVKKLRDDCALSKVK